MNSEHLSEAEIQNYALGTAGPDQAEHVDSCLICHSRVTNYSLIFSVMDELPEPVLDFDAAELVMSHLPQPTAVRGPGERGVYLIACLVLTLLGVPVYLNIDDLLKMTSGLRPVTLYLVGLTTLVVLIFQVTESCRQHLKKINALIAGDMQL